MRNIDDSNILPIGTNVRIINYGHKIWIRDPYMMDHFRRNCKEIILEDNNDFIFIDLAIERVGKEGIIVKHSSSPPVDYSIHFTESKETISWFSRDQLKVI